MRTTVLAVALAVLGGATLAACGGSSSGVSTADVQAYNTDARDVAAAADAYAIQAATMGSAAACATDESGYDGQVRPLVGRMQGHGAGMDAMMGSMGHLVDGDMECTANAMLAELDRHRAAACLSPADMGPNVTEAQQHAFAMSQWASHAASRSHDLGVMMGMGMSMGAGGTTSGHCTTGSGGYALGP